MEENKEYRIFSFKRRPPVNAAFGKGKMKYTPHPQIWRLLENSLEKALFIGRKA